VIQPERVFLLRDLNKPHQHNHATVVASSVRVEETTVTKSAAEYLLRGPSAITNHQAVLRAKARPTRVEINGTETEECQWQESANLLRLNIPYQPSMRIKI